MTKLTIFVAIYAAFCTTKCFSTLDVNQEEITKLTERLFKAADLSFYPKLKINTKKNPLLTIDEVELTKSKTVNTMRNLFDNYEPDTSIPEIETAAEIKEQDQFIQALLETEVMKELMKFLANKKAVANRPAEQRLLLKNLWFKLYSRGNKILGSCGFEHVFMHEIHGDKIMGLHNWIYFHDLQQKDLQQKDIQQKDNKLQLEKFEKQLTFENKASAMKFSFSYDNKAKVTSMFVGTRPELDIALYSLCIVWDVEYCKFSLGGQEFTIRAFSFKRDGNTIKVVASAYPNI